MVCFETIVTFFFIAAQFWKYTRQIRNTFFCTNFILMPKGGQNYFRPLPQLLKVVRAICLSSFAHEVVLVKFELQTHMEHLSSCQSGFLVACASQSFVFWVFVIFCQPLNICLFVMLYLYIYIIFCY
jgi:hypothetical protein